jgi:hypothetical protein
MAGNKMNGTGSGSCPVVSFGISGVEPSGPDAKKLTSYLGVFLKSSRSVGDRKITSCPHVKVFWFVMPCSAEDGGSMDLRNFGILSHYTASQPRRP